MSKTFPPAVAPDSVAGRAQPRLAVDELILRPWALSDAPVVVAAYGDPLIQRWHCRSMTLAEAEQWVTAANPQLDRRDRGQLGGGRGRDTGRTHVVATSGPGGGSG